MEQKIPLSLVKKPVKNRFKRKIKQKLKNILNADNSYIGVPELIQNMKCILLRSLEICYLTL